MPPPGTLTDFGSGCVTPLDLQDTTLVFIGSTSAMGTATMPVPIPMDTSLIGAVLITQVLVTSPGGPMLGVAELTNSLEQTLGF